MSSQPAANEFPENDAPEADLQEKAPVRDGVNLERMPTLNRLQAAAHFYGVTAAPPATAAVLAIGKGWEPLLTWACVFGGASLVLLLDTEDDVIYARREVERLGCKNVQVLTLWEPGPLSGSFDYVIVHGLYSRLPAKAGEELLQLCTAMLSAGGIACVDYDVYPGGKSLENVLQLVGLHLHGIDNPHEADAAVRAILRYLEEGSAPGEVCTPAQQEAARRVLAELNDNGIQALWAERRGPCHFLEFAANAEAAALVCVGDIEPLRDVPRMFGTTVALNHSLHALGKPALVRQQYLDFATGRWRRSSLLVKADSAVSGSVPNLTRMTELQWAAGFQRLDGSNIAPGQASFMDALGRTLHSTSAVLTAMVDVLSWAWPSSVSLEALHREVSLATACKDETADYLTDRILDALQDLMIRGMVEYSLGPGPYDLQPDRPATLLPGFARTLTEDVTAQKPRDLYNLWGQVIHNRFPGQDIDILTSLEQGFEGEIGALGDAAGKENIAVFQAGKLIYQNPIKSRQQRLSLLNWHGLILSGAQSWETVLRSLLLTSDGCGPYWSEYVAALARVRVQSLEGDGGEEFRPTPQMQRRLDGLLDQQARLGQSREVEPLVRQLVAAAPNWVAPLELLSRCLIDLGGYDEALAWILQAFSTKNYRAQTYLVLAAVLSAKSRTHETIVAARQTLALDPDKNQAYLALGNALKLARRYKEAELNYRVLLDRDPGSGGLWVNLLSVLTEMGLIEDALEIGERGLKKFPALPGLRSNYFFALNYSQRSAQEIYAKYSEAEAQIYSSGRTFWKSHRNSRNTKRRLKIGYVSPDFRAHAVARFLEPLLANHDHTQFHITAYADLFAEDGYTERFKSYVDVWRNTTGWTAEAAATRIREDEIDILIDVAGHTGNNRLTTFALKPAPISVTWLGFGYTTGLKAIDYVLMDNEMAPAGSEELFSETPWRLSGTPFVLRIPGQAKIALEELPALRNGYVRFCTLSRAIRINPELVLTWASILKRVPGSKLIVDSSNFDDPWVAKRLRGMFAEQGVTADRLEVGFHTPPWKLLNQVDIGLDCFPHNSGTTLIEMLYMGLPYVTMRSRPSVGRLGASILSSINRSEWIANSPEEYADIVVSLASDLPALAEIRAGLRAAMENSRLMDEAGFAREVEEAYHAMFRRWCDEQRKGEA